LPAQLLNSTAARGAPQSPPLAGNPNYHEDRHTVGIDARWRIGGFGFDPTIYYQWGRIDSQAVDNSPGANGVATKKVTADMSAWLIDLILSYQLGPMVIEARGGYSTGNKARDNLAKGIRYYQPLDTDGNYWAGGWTQFWASGIDYFNQGWPTTGNYVGYDRYGRGSIAGRITYSLTPALSLYGVVHTFLTAQAVDTDTSSVLATTGGTGFPARLTSSQKSWVSGDSNYLGTELNLGLTWYFSANAAFDLVGGYLFAGSALDASECRGTLTIAGVCTGQVVKMDSKDAYTLTARVRLAF
jgi:Alginate export